MKIYRFPIDIVIMDKTPKIHDEVYMQILKAIRQTDPVAEVHLLPSGEFVWDIHKPNKIFDGLKPICSRINSIAEIFYKVLGKN